MHATQGDLFNRGGGSVAPAPLITRRQPRLGNTFINSECADLFGDEPLSPYNPERHTFSHTWGEKPRSQSNSFNLLNNLEDPILTNEFEDDFGRVESLYNNTIRTPGSSRVSFNLCPGSSSVHNGRDGGSSLPSTSGYSQARDPHPEFVNDHLPANPAPTAATYQLHHQHSPIQILTERLQQEQQRQRQQHTGLEQQQATNGHIEEARKVLQKLQEVQAQQQQAQQQSSTQSTQQRPPQQEPMFLGRHQAKAKEQMGPLENSQLDRQLINMQPQHIRQGQGLSGLSGLTSASTLEDDIAGINVVKEKLVARRLSPLGNTFIDIKDDESGSDETDFLTDPLLERHSFSHFSLEHRRKKFTLHGFEKSSESSSVSEDPIIARNNSNNSKPSFDRHSETGYTSFATVPEDDALLLSPQEPSSVLTETDNAPTPVVRRRSGGSGTGTNPRAAPGQPPVQNYHYTPPPQVTAPRLTNQQESEPMYIQVSGGSQAPRSLRVNADLDNYHPTEKRPHPVQRPVPGQYAMAHEPSYEAGKPQPAHGTPNNSQSMPFHGTTPAIGQHWQSPISNQQPSPISNPQPCAPARAVKAAPAPLPKSNQYQQVTNTQGYPKYMAGMTVNPTVSQWPGNVSNQTKGVSKGHQTHSSNRNIRQPAPMQACPSSVVVEISNQFDLDPFESNNFGNPANGINGIGSVFAADGARTEAGRFDHPEGGHNQMPHPGPDAQEYFQIPDRPVMSDKTNTEHHKTTLMVRNIPPKCTQESLLQVWPPDGSYDMLYLPFSFESRRNCSYAFVNFVTHAAATHFKEQWHKKYLGIAHGAKKALDIGFAVVQGRDENMRQFLKYKISRIKNMHYQPAIFEGIERVDFRKYVQILGGGTIQAQQNGDHEG